MATRERLPRGKPPAPTGYRSRTRSFARSKEPATGGPWSGGRAVDDQAQQLARPVSPSDTTSPADRRPEDGELADRSLGTTEPQARSASRHGGDRQFIRSGGGGTGGWA